VKFRFRRESLGGGSTVAKGRKGERQPVVGVEARGSVQGADRPEDIAPGMPRFAEDGMARSSRRVCRRLAPAPASPRSLQSSPARRSRDAVRSGATTVAPSGLPSRNPPISRSRATPFPPSACDMSPRS
jgi:hypothetical protein